MSLAQLSEWCAQRFGAHVVEHDAGARQFDVPWLILDSHLAHDTWSWRPVTTTKAFWRRLPNAPKDTRNGWNSRPLKLELMQREH
jgi:hypothetical protein